MAQPTRVRTRHTRALHARATRRPRATRATCHSHQKKAPELSLKSTKISHLEQTHEEQQGARRAPGPWPAVTDRHAQRHPGKVNRAVTELVPHKGSITKFQKLPREQQVAVITEAKKVIKKLDNGLLAGSVREL